MINECVSVSSILAVLSVFHNTHLNCFACFLSLQTFTFIRVGCGHSFDMGKVDGLRIKTDSMVGLHACITLIETLSAAILSFPHNFFISIHLYPKLSTFNCYFGKTDKQCFLNFIPSCNSEDSSVVVFFLAWSRRYNMHSLFHEDVNCNHYKASLLKLGYLSGM